MAIFDRKSSAERESQILRMEVLAERLEDLLVSAANAARTLDMAIERAGKANKQADATSRQAIATVNQLRRTSRNR